MSSIGSELATNQRYVLLEVFFLIMLVYTIVQLLVPLSTGPPELSVGTLDQEGTIAPYPDIRSSAGARRDGCS